MIANLRSGSLLSLLSHSQIVVHAHGAQRPTTPRNRLDMHIIRCADQSVANVEHDEPEDRPA